LKIPKEHLRRTKCSRSPDATHWQCVWELWFTAYLEKKAVVIDRHCSHALA